MDKESGVYKNAIYIEGDIHHNVYSALYRLEREFLWSLYLSEVE